MFLLNIYQQRCKQEHHRHFNTSHVSIKLALFMHSFSWAFNFNTSHVSIKQDSRKGVGECFKDFNTSHVSIKLINSDANRNITGISIHPMFLLNALGYTMPVKGPAISIHPMFLLNFKAIVPSQYKAYFNTSHVSIKLHRCVSVFWSCIDFNTSHVSIKLSYTAKAEGGSTYFNTSHVSIKQNKLDSG